MSILIKGMEMPKDCQACNFGYDGCCLAMNPIQTRDWRYEDNAKHCPLIELQPHGRLIDADALKIEDGWIAELRGHSNVQFVYANDIINAPTIIEAEDSFFNSLKRGLEQAINGDVRETTIIEAEPKWCAECQKQGCSECVTGIFQDGTVSEPTHFQHIQRVEDDTPTIIEAEVEE